MAEDYDFADPLASEDAQQDEPEEVPESERYWASRTAELTIGELQAKERVYAEYVQRRGFGSAWVNSYAHYYGQDPSGYEWSSQSVGFDGQEAELLRFRVAEARSFIKQSMNMALGERASFSALAVNTDYDTLASVESADTAINYIYWQHYAERKERRVVEAGDLFGSAFTWCSFDPDGGEEIEVKIPLPPEMGGGPSPATQKQRTGEIIVKAKMPWELFFDPTIPAFDDHVWRCVKDRISKWELIARFPEHRERLLRLSCKDEPGIEGMFGLDGESVNSDELIARHFYHAKTRALPAGRYLVYVGDLALYDGPLPFRQLPFSDYCPSEMIGSALGYADSWDLLPLGDMLDQIVSDIASNLSTFGRQSIAAEQGIEFDPEMLANGFHVLTIPPNANPPTPIMLAAIPDAAKFFLEYLESRFESISGINAIARGSTSTMPSSGTLAALFHSIAQEVNSAKQMAVDAHRERTANLLLSIVQDFVQHPMMVQVVGADERPYLQSITRDTFKGVRKVVIKTANPMLRTTAGRLEIAQMLLQIDGAVQTPQQINEVLVSGQIKPLIKAPRAEMLRIAWENEALAAGPETVQKPDLENPFNPDGSPRTYDCVESVPVLTTDPHHKHVPEHLAGIASPQASQNPAVLKAHLAHVYEHLRQYKSMDPALAALLGFPAPPPMPGIMPTIPANDNAEDHEGGSPAPLRAISGGARDSTGVKLPKPAEPPPGTRVQ